MLIIPSEEKLEKREANMHLIDDVVQVDGIHGRVGRSVERA